MGVPSARPEYNSHSRGAAFTAVCARIATTTAAAKYGALLRNALPEVVIVEEAGEILESHVLTALSERTRRLVLIGDHK